MGRHGSSWVVIGAGRPLSVITVDLWSSFLSRSRPLAFNKTGSPDRHRAQHLEKPILLSISVPLWTAVWFSQLDEAVGLSTATNGFITTERAETHGMNHRSTARHSFDARHRKTSPRACHHPLDNPPKMVRHPFYVPVAKSSARFSCLSKLSVVKNLLVITLRCGLFYESASSVQTSLTGDQ